MTDIQPQRHGAEVAVIGMACRFPGAPDADAFWDNLRNGRESIVAFSEAEAAAAGVPPVLLARPDFVRAGALLDGVDLFDPALFGLTPREAEVMDPQHRLLLQCAWEALESAGYDSDRHPGLIGIWAGASAAAYLLNLLAHREVAAAVGGFQLEIGNEKDHLAPQVAYRLNLRGPAVTIQTGCSTSLVAVHLAVQSLLGFECDLALAGGVSIDLPQRPGYLHQEGGVASPDGHCRAFDARAAGTVFGSGVGLVVLKRLEEALADGDTVLAVIKGSAVNNDGSRKVGYTAPSVAGQAEVITQALAMARLAPREISYVEAHGTGTVLGDPVEAAALVRAFGPAGGPGTCALGAVKTNVGHLNVAAGLAGFIKAVQMLRHRQIPPTLHFERLNPEIDFGRSPFYVETRLRDWDPPGGIRRAGVSSFSIGGTNAHVVLEEAPPVPEAPADRRSSHLLVLSARTPAALESATEKLATFLESGRGADLAGVAHTLQVGRRELAHRRAVVARSVEDAVEALRRLPAERSATGAAPGGHRPVVFLFPGQGTRLPGAGRSLYAAEPLFRREIDRSTEVLASRFDLRRLLFAERYDEEAARQLSETALAQPVLFTLEHALARLWIERLGRPQIMLGHSLGEYVAACVAGTFAFEEALDLVAERGQLIQETPPGAMLAVPLAEEETLALLDGDAELSLAAVNEPAGCVVSGPAAAVERCEERLAARGLAGRRLPVTRAFHSALVEPAVAVLVERVARMRLSLPEIPWISNLTGRPVLPEEAVDPAYWGRHLRRPVRFADGIGEILADPDRVLLEVGPGDALGRLVRRHPACRPETQVVSSLGRAEAGLQEDEALATALGRLWAAGVEVEWPSGHRARRMLLPTYPFERHRYWIDGSNGADPPDLGLPEPPRDDLADPAGWFSMPTWKRTPLPDPLAAQPAEDEGDWLVAGEHSGLASALAGKLRQSGREVFIAEPGPRFGRLGERAWAIQFAERADWAALLAAIAKEGGRPGRVLHLGCFAAGEGASPDGRGEVEGEGEWLERGFYSLLAFAQAIGDRGLGHPMLVGVISSGMQAVAGETALFPVKATALGPCRVIPKEYPNLACRSIDVTPPPPRSWQETRLAERVLAEMGSGPADFAVAYRDQARWAMTLEPVRLESPPAGALPAKLRERGVYLITGGLEGIGLAVARDLARRVRARLVLAGRAPLPAEGVLVELEAAGAEVLAAPGIDVANRGAMAGVVERARQRFGPLHGVIHAEEPAGSGLIQFRDRAASAAVLATKVGGMRVLDELLSGLGLDFFVLFSSAFALTGGLGLVDHCAANAFLDAFAQCESPRRETLLLALDWSVW
ncbi:MAG TPA: type I polyketide synthase, partial [Thermoanaerobaculia bacterium]|nr:type I polyketide synthase [Thermoanaerobaculia bacterium]